MLFMLSALRRVVEKYSAASLPSIPRDKEKAGYGSIQLQKTALLFDLLDTLDPADVVESENPISMESIGQDYGSGLHIPKVHDRAQVFVACPSGDNGGRPTYVGTIQRWSNQALSLPNARCVSNISLYILVENMGRVNYGKYLFDEKVRLLFK
ncbi:hypothetical protein JRO89_XS09G0217900 [Xanthoceras sorbifolium]|uniref:Beta-galactosidase 1-like first all-beta domain-containing protein n=1 Tax=Xanthoceras sorbifolium TaxID=99658 RepID=A0ABQ8HMB0_9ROSI|nr:hypothetical protein JRO89_XS09G0217900 [Xanthoceras sorbifolium]